MVLSVTKDIVIVLVVWMEDVVDSADVHTHITGVEYFAMNQ